MAIYRLDGRDGDFGVVDEHCFSGLSDDGELAPRCDQGSADLEEISPVTRQLRLQNGTIIGIRRHLGKKEHSVQLSRKLELVDSPMLIDDGVLILAAFEGEKFVVMIDAELGSIVPKVLNNLCVGGLFGMGKGPLQIWEAVVLRQRRMILSVVCVGFLLGVSAVRIRMVVGPWARRMLRGR